MDEVTYQIYLVSTPIGNLQDISLRAVNILRNVDVIACEDTRKSGKLLSHFGIEKKNPLVSFYEQNEQQSLKRLIGFLNSGKTVALITSAGTPGISDPGFILVRYAIENEISISMIPGPSALIIALVLSGLPTHSFTFRGFPPRKTNQLRKFLLIDENSPHTLIFYESPHRLVKFLEECFGVFGDRRVAVLNDLTKMYETIKRGKLSEVIPEINISRIQGEYVVVLEGTTPDSAKEKN